MSIVCSSPFPPKAIFLSLHGDRVNLLRRDYNRRQQHQCVGAFASRHTANYNDNVITHRYRVRQLYSPICEHETRHGHEIANHYKDWCRTKIGRRAKKRAKRMINARTAVSCAPQREALQIPCFEYPRYRHTAIGCDECVVCWRNSRADKIVIPSSSGHWVSIAGDVFRIVKRISGDRPHISTLRFPRHTVSDRKVL